MEDDSTEKEFAEMYAKLNSANQNYANCVLQTLIFAQSAKATKAQN